MSPATNQLFFLDAATNQEKRRRLQPMRKKNAKMSLLGAETFFVVGGDGMSSQGAAN